MAFANKRNVQEIIDLMRQNADSLDKLCSYPLNAKQLFDGNRLVSEYFYDSGDYYTMSYTQHFIRYEDILTWLEVDHNKPGIANTLEREHERALDNAKTVDQNSQEIKFIHTEQFPNIVKAKDPSLNPEEVKKEFKDDHAFRVGLLKHAITRMAEIFRDIAKHLEAGEEIQEHPTWTSPLGIKKWASVFKVSESTIRRWFKKNTYKNKKISDRKWSILYKDLPAEVVARVEK